MNIKIYLPFIAWNNKRYFINNYIITLILSWKVPTRIPSDLKSEIKELLKSTGSFTVNVYDLTHNLNKNLEIPKEHKKTNPRALVDQVFTSTPSREIFACLQELSNSFANRPTKKIAVSTQRVLDENIPNFTQLCIKKMNGELYSIRNKSLR